MEKVIKTVGSTYSNNSTLPVNLRMCAGKSADNEAKERMDRNALDTVRDARRLRLLIPCSITYTHAADQKLLLHHTILKQSRKLRVNHTAKYEIYSAVGQGNQNALREKASEPNRG